MLKPKTEEGTESYFNQINPRYLAPTFLSLGSSTFLSRKRGLRRVD